MPAKPTIDYFEFQSTLPREERPMLARVGYKQYRFQSTLPREERHSIGSHGANSWYFNPRSHERSDDNELTTLDAVERISIHAPTRGATANKTTNV